MKVALLFFSFFYMIPATTIADSVGGVQLPTWVQKQHPDPSSEEGWTCININKSNNKCDQWQREIKKPSTTNRKGSTFPIRRSESNYSVQPCKGNNRTGCVMDVGVWKTERAPAQNDATKQAKARAQSRNSRSSGNNNVASDSPQVASERPTPVTDEPKTVATQACDAYGECRPVTTVKKICERHPRTGNCIEGTETPRQPAQADSNSGTGEATSDSNTCESAATRATTCCQDAPKCFGGKAASALTTINEFASIFSMASPMISGGKDISKLCKNIQMLSAAASVVTLAATKKCKKTIKNCESVCEQEKGTRCALRSDKVSCEADLEKRKKECSELEQYATSFKDAGVQLIMTIATTEKCIRDAAGVKVEKCIKAKGQWTEKHGCVTREKCKKELKGQWDTKNNECTGKVMCEEDKNGKWNPTKQECEDEQSCSAKQGDWDPVKKICPTWRDCGSKYKGRWNNPTKTCVTKEKCEKAMGGNWNAQTRRCTDPTRNLNTNTNNPNNRNSATNTQPEVTISPIDPPNGEPSGETTDGETTERQDRGGGGNKTTSGSATSGSTTSSDMGGSLGLGDDGGGSTGSQGGGGLANNAQTGSGGFSGFGFRGGGSKGTKKKAKRGGRRGYAGYGRGGFGGYGGGGGGSSGGEDSYANLKLGKKEMDKMKAKQGAKIGVGNNTGMHQSLFMRVTLRYNSVCQQFKLHCE